MRTCPQCRRRFVQGEAFCPYDGARLRDAPRDPTVQPVEQDPLVGARLDGRYQLESVLGRGGMGTVYAGRQTAINKPVAIKVLREVDDDGQAMGRFEREARSASKLGHAHIVDIFDFGRTPHPLGGPDALAYLVMELLDGEDLGALLQRRGSLPLDRIVPIVLQCCSALGAAHAAGIVHRDLKPENIFLVTDQATGSTDSVKVVDFGLAKITETETDGDPERKLTQTGMIFGTPHYMPPEQCMGKPTDPRADVYSLGIIFYEALTGKPPFDGSTFMSVINQHLLDPPPPLAELNPAVDVPPAIEQVIQKALAKVADDRHGSMKAFADAVLAALAGTRWAGLAPQLAPLASIPVASPETFAATAVAQPVVDLEAAAAARAATAPPDAQRASGPVFELSNPKPPSGATPIEPAPHAPPAHAPLAPSGTGAKQLIPATRRAIDVASPSMPSPEADKPRFSSAASASSRSSAPPAGPSLQPLQARGPKVPSSVPPPPTSSGARAVGWVLGAILLLLIGGALGYGALLLAR